MARTEVIVPDNRNTSGWQLLFIRLRYKEGRLIKPDNKPIVLDDPDTVWIVYSGKVDVFSVRVEDGEPVGARQHLFRVEQDSAVFGIDLTGRKLGLVATCGPKVELVSVRRSNLERMATDPDFAGPIAILLDKWMGLLSANLSQKLPPREFTLIEGSANLSLDDQAVVRARKGIVWVEALEGTVSFADRADIAPIGPACALPIAEQTWLRALGPVALRVVDTATFVHEANFWAHLKFFHNLAMDCITNNAQQREIVERARLRQRSESDKLRMQGAFSQLASILEPARADASSAGDEQDRLFEAARLVGAAGGIVMRPYEGKQSQRDPLANIARSSRVRIRSVILKGEWWKNDSGPMLAFIKETENTPNHPVALLPSSPTSYDLVDSVTGTRVPITANVAEALAGVAYVFYRPFPDRVLGVRDLFRFGLLGLRNDLGMVLLMSAAMGLLATLVPIVTGVIFDSIIPGAQRPQLIQIAVVLAVVALVNAAFQVVRAIAMQRLEGRLDFTLQAALYDRLLELPATFFRDYSAGDLGARAMGISAIRQILSKVVLNSLLTSVFSIFSVGLLFAYSVPLALTAIIMVVALVIIMTGMSLLQVRYQRKLADVQGYNSGLIPQLINGVAKFRVAGAEQRAFAYWAKQFAAQRKLAFQTRLVTSVSEVVNAVFPVATSIVIFWSVTASAGQFTTGSFLAFNAAFTQFLVAAIGMSMAFSGIMQIVPLYERAKPILQTLPEVDDAKSDPGEMNGAIEVSHVTFRYRQDGPPILNDISLSIKPGEFVALVGPSGSGKSTFLRLLLGFETPESGEILYDHQVLSGLDVRLVRSQIGVVLQNGRLMMGDISSNIIASSSALTIEDAWEAARMAGLAEDIELMPMKMQTVVSEGGSTLSGGQRQRLMIARAIATKPHIVFFDEATSALDNRSQEIVSKSLEGLAATRVVIAHRLSTIINADRVYVFQNGVIVQSGTYSELVNQSGLFAELAKRQMA